MGERAMRITDAARKKFLQEFRFVVGGGDEWSGESLRQLDRKLVADGIQTLRHLIEKFELMRLGHKAPGWMPRPRQRRSERVLDFQLRRSLIRAEKSARKFGLHLDQQSEYQ